MINAIYIKPRFCPRSGGYVNICAFHLVKTKLPTYKNKCWIISVWKCFWGNWHAAACNFCEWILSWLSPSGRLSPSGKVQSCPALPLIVDVQVKLKASFKVTETLVNCPTRWSLLFIFGFLCWSSSWWWWPHIGGGKKFRPLLRAGLTVLVQFFCKMYILWVSWSRKKNLADFFWVLPPQTRRFFQRGPKCQNGGLAHFFEQPPFLTFFSLRL